MAGKSRVPNGRPEPMDWPPLSVGRPKFAAARRVRRFCLRICKVNQERVGTLNESMNALFRRWGRATCRTEFETVLAPHIETLYHRAYRLTGGAAAAEDLVQDVLVKSYAQWDAVGRYERLDVWLARVMHNEYIDGWRRNRLHPRCWSELSENDLESANAFPDPRHSANPPRMAADHQLQLRLMEGLSRLSPQHRAILLFHDVEEYSLQECAAIFSQPIGTCKSRIFRARSKLREYMRYDVQDWVDEDPLPGVH